MVMEARSASAGGAGALPAAAERLARRAVPRDAFSQLVQRAQDGDRDAFAAIYRYRARDVGRYVGAIVRDPDFAEDVVADSFLTAWRKLGDLRNVDRFDAWLFRIAYNTTIDEIRRRKRERNDEAIEVLLDAEARSEDIAERLSNADLLRTLLANLTDEQRDVIVLRFLRELPHREIAHVTGKSEDAVRQLQARALASMRRHMRTRALAPLRR